VIIDKVALTNSFKTAKAIEQHQKKLEYRTRQLVIVYMRQSFNYCGKKRKTQNEDINEAVWI
jgi:hypothetical protein